MSYDLRRRLKALPASLYPLVRSQALKQAGGSANMWMRMLDGSIHSVKLAQALCQVCCCTLDQLLDPAYEFDHAAIRARMGKAVHDQAAASKRRLRPRPVPPPPSADPVSA
ncbi:MAG: hypothetical protein NW241_10920 [Bacteroidia bacterium]|nr:hypothetical protein [Bacteroidia bacterium]